MVKVSPSILSVNVDDIKNEVKKLELAGADFIHIDVMDGIFVKNKTDGIAMISNAKYGTKLPFDTHLMVENPIEHIDDYLDSSIITFHTEAVDENELLRTINYIKSKNIKVGIALKPNTSIDSILSIIDMIDLVLVMSVEPGMGGQKFITSTLSKIKELRKLYPDLIIEVDGGINLENVEDVKNAGASIVVAGTAIINATDKKEIIQKIKA